MIKIIVPDMNDLFNNQTNEFTSIKGGELRLEHSLISLKKWESKWHKPFMASKDKSYDEIIDYIRCMTLNNAIDESIYTIIPSEAIEKIVEYINDPMTATWFSDKNNIPSGGRNEIITNEIIYYWMISLNIPIECEKWHLNQLLTLIKVISIKNSPKKKMSKHDEAAQRKALVEARRAKYHTRG